MTYASNGAINMLKKTQRYQEIISCFSLLYDLKQDMRDIIANFFFLIICIFFIVWNAEVKKLGDSEDWSAVNLIFYILLE